MPREQVPGFGVRVRKARESRGWSLADLAERAGTNRASVWKIETGQRAPSLWLALCLANALDVQLVADLCGGFATPLPPPPATLKRSRRRSPSK